MYYIMSIFPLWEKPQIQHFFVMYRVLTSLPLLTIIRYTRSNTLDTIVEQIQISAIKDQVRIPTLIEFDSKSLIDDYVISRLDCRQSASSHISLGNWSWLVWMGCIIEFTCFILIEGPSSRYQLNNCGYDNLVVLIIPQLS